MAKKLNWRKKTEEYISERTDEIKDFEEGEERDNAEKDLTERMRAYAEYLRAKGEIFKAIAMGVTGIAALGTFGVELYKAVTKNRTNEKILDNQINLMEQYEKNTFNNK